MSKIKQSILASAVSDLETHAPDGISQTFRFTDDFIGFSGHFPGFPVLPAFVHILTAQVVLESHVGHALTLSQLTNAKFLVPIRPMESAWAR